MLRRALALGALALATLLVLVLMFRGPAYEVSLTVDNATPEVDLDAVLNTIGPAAQHDLHELVSAGSGLISPQAEKQGNDGLRALNPALSQSADTAREIVRDEPAFERFILESANVV